MIEQIATGLHDVLHAIFAVLLFQWSIGVHPRRPFGENAG